MGWLEKYLLFTQTVALQMGCIVWILAIIGWVVEGKWVAAATGLPMVFLLCAACTFFEWRLKQEWRSNGSCRGG